MHETLGCTLRIRQLQVQGSAHLHEDGQQDGGIPLVRQHIFLHEWIEVEQQEPVDAHDSRDDAHHGQPHFKALARRLVQPFEQLLGKILQSMDALDRVHDGKQSLLSHMIRRPAVSNLVC